MRDNDHGPRGIALLMCDDIRERDGKKDLLGLFDEFKAQSFPARIARFYVLVSIGGSGNHECALTLADENGTVVRAGGFKAVVPPTTGTYEILVPFDDTVLEHAGTYLMRLWNEKRVLLERSIVARLK